MDVDAPKYSLHLFAGAGGGLLADLIGGETTVVFDMQRNGIRSASLRHDALARKRYVKPFKWFKFNRARKATAK